MAFSTKISGITVLSPTVFRASRTIYRTKGIFKALWPPIPISEIHFVFIAGYSEFIWTRLALFFKVRFFRNC